MVKQSFTMNTTDRDCNRQRHFPSDAYNDAYSAYMSAMLILINYQGYIHACAQTKQHPETDAHTYPSVFIAITK